MYLTELQLRDLDNCCLLNEYTNSTRNYWNTTDRVNDDINHDDYIEASEYQSKIYDILNERFYNQCGHPKVDFLTENMIENSRDNW